MTTTAMAAAGAGGAQPCRAGKPPLWYGVAINNWRDCLEALMAGDFLTPVFIGVMFHDTVRFGWWRDRGALLEDAWQRHYLSVVAKTSDQKPAGGCLGLDCAFTALRPTAQHWFPLLLLNGVSVETGQRIVTAILKPNYTPKDGNRCPTGDRPDAAASSCLLLAQTFDFHKLLADATEPKGWLAKAQRYLMKDYRHNRKLDDVWLSTAAHNSARFPLISPPGNIRNGAHQIIDRIVDGGYFEGFGALTAMEIALAVRAAEPKLAPFVVVVSNDPNLAIDHDDDSVLVQQQDKLPDTPDVEFFTEVVGPLTTFINAWNAHGGLAVKQLRSVLYRTMPECENVAHIRVWPESQERSERSRAVSMSWWLSKPIQRHLHQQTEDVKNKKQNRESINKVWRALAPTSTCGKR